MKKQTILTPYYLDQQVQGLNELAQTDWILNQPQLPNASSQVRMSVLYKELSKHVNEIASAGNLPVSIAGDCCTAIGVMAGLHFAGLEPLLIWFDAHGDFNTWETTPSGFLGGMPLAMLAGLGEQTMMQAVNLPPVAQEQIILTDGRDLDSGEKELILGSKIIHISNPLNLLEYPFPERPIYVHIDTDVINPLDAPAMNYVAKGGLRVADLSKVFRHIAQTGWVKAISISSWNPDLDEDGGTKENCFSLLQEFVA